VDLDGLFRSAWLASNLSFNIPVTTNCITSNSRGVNTSAHPQSRTQARDVVHARESQTPNLVNRPNAIAATRKFAPTRRHRSKTRCCSNQSCRRSIGRKDKSKPRATSISVFNCDRAAVRFHNRSHNCQTHSQPFVFSGEERIEHTVPHLL
jgi:hypothetical protein